MITRDFRNKHAIAGWDNPPPLVTYTPEAIAASWFPVPRPVLRPTPGGPQYVFRIPTVPFGDDPTDPAMQTKPRIATMGMIGRFHEKAGGGR